MIDIESSLTEIKDTFQQIIQEPGRLFEMMRFDLRGIAERALTSNTKARTNPIFGERKIPKGYRGRAQLQEWIQPKEIHSKAYRRAKPIHPQGQEREISISYCQEIQA